ncbi:MAG: hypothetical protein HOL31_01985 [Candidatus Scalindua sp.]|jgi:hypothetical protein|nr:hypothetical protein [Candidatus Scalindua sp.]MBT7349846.1 hypothetical protein [candidate division WWE3 bacterium]
MKQIFRNIFRLFFDCEPDISYEHVVKIDGYAACTTDVTEDSLTVYGWSYDHHKYKEKDRILIIQSGQESRYKIKRITRPWDVSDQYFLDCIFEPRIK